jgi:hypothetical protein
MRGADLRECTQANAIQELGPVAIANLEAALAVMRARNERKGRRMVAFSCSEGGHGTR